MIESPAFITKNELIALYEKLYLYISANYPFCAVIVNQKSVSFGYPNEYTRIFVYQDKDQTSLVLKISQDLSRKMDANNGLLYQLKTMEDFHFLKSGIKVIMEYKVPKLDTSVTNQPEDLPAAPVKLKKNVDINALLSKLKK